MFRLSAPICAAVLLGSTLTAAAEEFKAQPPAPASGPTSAGRLQGSKLATASTRLQMKALNPQPLPPIDGGKGGKKKKPHPAGNGAFSKPR